MDSSLSLLIPNNVLIKKKGSSSPKNKHLKAMLNQTLFFFLNKKYGNFIIMENNVIKTKYEKLKKNFRIEHFL